MSNSLGVWNLILDWKIMDRGQLGAGLSQDNFHLNIHTDSEDLWINMWDNSLDTQLMFVFFIVSAP